MGSYRTSRMSRSFLPVTVNPVASPGPSLSPVSAGYEAPATTPATNLLDADAVWLLANFFLLLAEWDAKQKNRDLSVEQAGTTTHDSVAEKDTAVAGATQTNRPSRHAGVTRKIATAGRADRFAARGEVWKEVAA